MRALILGCMGVATVAVGGCTARAPRPQSAAPSYPVCEGIPASVARIYENELDDSLWGGRWGTITGLVRNSADGTALQAVQVYTDSGIGALTNRAGRYFLLNVPANAPIRIHFELGGYTPQSIVVEPDVAVVQVDAALGLCRQPEPGLIIRSTTLLGVPG